MADHAPRTWTEQMLHELEPHEHDFQEFKGSAWLSPTGDSVQPDFRQTVSRQVSAFANGAGGHLFIGIDDDGRIDGGVRTDLKGGGTRAWLEDIVPDSVDPRLSRCNVFEVVGDGSTESAILPGHAVYVLHMPASEDAPHQAADHRYYLRIAGKSRPMGHVHVQDVLHRTRHPRIAVTRVSPYGEFERVDDDPRGPKAYLCFQVHVGNQGHRLAHHVGVELLLPRPAVDTVVRRRMLDRPSISLTQQRPGEVVFFRYHPIPLFPQQEICFFERIWLALHTKNIEAFASDQAVLRLRCYADDSPVLESATPLRRFLAVKLAMTWLEEQLSRQ